jgi:hypothetical protein
MWELRGARALAPAPGPSLENLETLGLDSNNVRWNMGHLAHLAHLRQPLETLSWTTTLIFGIMEVLRALAPHLAHLTISLAEG